MSHICVECRRPIPNGEAVIRSVSLQRVAWHADCYELRGIQLATFAGTLAERLHRAG